MLSFISVFSTCVHNGSLSEKNLVFISYKRESLQRYFRGKNFPENYMIIFENLGELISGI